MRKRESLIKKICKVIKQHGCKHPKKQLWCNDYSGSGICLDCGATVYYTDCFDYEPPPPNAEKTYNRPEISAQALKELYSEEK